MPYSCISPLSSTNMWCACRIVLSRCATIMEVRRAMRRSIAYCKHIGVKLYLVIEEKGKRNIYNTQRPAPAVGFGRQCHGYQPGHHTKEFQIAQGVAKDFNENVFDVEESHSLKFHANILRLGKEPHRFPTTFPTNSGLFHSAKRCAQITEQPAVHPNDPALHLRCNAMSFF